MMKPESQKEANWDLALTALPILEAPDFRAGSWCSKPDTFPFYAFDPGAMRVLEILHEFGVIRPFNWVAWQSTAERLYRAPKALGRARLSTLGRLLTVHVRKDRFCEGHLASMFESGHITAILRRAAELLSTRRRRMRKLKNTVSPLRIKEVTSSVLGSIQAAPKRTSEAARAVVGGVTAGSRKARDSAISLTNGLLTTTQGLLASALSTDLNGLLQDMVSGSATIYDKAMDAVYNATRIGGGNHRLFDGGHTIAGAVEAVRDASPEDTILEEAMGFLQGIFRDMTTVKGLPLANWDKATYDQVAGFLESQFRIPRDWFYDLISYDASELLGGVIGVVATALHWNRADIESFSKLVGGMGVSAVMSKNPLLLIVTVVALAKAFHRAHHTGDYADFVDGHLKGGIGAGGTLAAVSLVGVAGGPAGLALLVGLSTGILINKAMKKVSVVEIGQFMTERAAVAATEIRLAAQPKLKDIG